ncbi:MULTISPECIES: ferredoxin [Vagococcus]|uniref:Ferredoxin n=2 Tax=Vagococcus TaxID=2737 RepID=A0A1J0A6C3_9ENTE|nr:MULTISPECIES: ferredoxin [Vagococcus]APB31457.1 ferredoxin [Vagococcus teuberi]OPF86867.1 ferredoxin [Vagococcus martis]
MLCKIIPEKCIACGLCQIKAPELFDYHDNGLVKFKDSNTLEEHFSEPIADTLLEAYQKCPTRAIELKK